MPYRQCRKSIPQGELHPALFGATAGPAWNSLIRDVLPQSGMGRLFSTWTVLGTVFALGVAFGVAGLLAILKFPEPRMPPQEKQPVYHLLVNGDDSPPEAPVDVQE